MQLKGMEFDFDFTDAEDLERYETAFEQLQKADTTAEKASEMVRKQCAATKAFFDAVLGKGAYEKLVSKPSSGLENANAILDFVEGYTQAMEQVEQQRAERLKKYKQYTAPKRRV